MKSQFKTGILVTCFCMFSFQLMSQLDFMYDKGSKVFYQIYNDPQSIVVKVKIGDPMQQLKMMRNGAEIWVDYKGKTTKRTGVKFPLLTNNGFQQPDGQLQRNGESPNMRPMIELMMLTRKEMELVGFKEELNGKYDIVGSSLVKINLGFGDKDTLLYTCSIPYTAFAQNLDFEKTFSIGIVLKGMERPDFGGGGFPGGGPPGGMAPPPGNMGGGRMRNGSGMPDMNEIEKMFSDNVIWQKIQFKL